MIAAFRSRSALLLAGFLLACGTAAAQSPNRADTAAAPKDPLSLGNAFYEKGNYTAAAEQYRLATQDTVSNLQRAFAWFNLGNCHVQTGSYNKAVVAYRRSLEEAPNFTRSYQLLGDVYYTLGDIGEATAAYTRLLELEETSMHAYQMLGECALKGGDITLALRDFDAAVKLEPDLPDLYLAMAEAYGRVRDYASAEKLLQEALLRISRPSAEGYFYLGQIYELDGQPLKAVRAYEEGLLLKPDRAEYYVRIAGIHERAGDDFLALLTLEQGLRAGGERADFHLRRGAIFFCQQRYDHALEEFRRAYALGEPQGRTGVENVAAVYFNTGKKDQAQEILKAIRAP